MPVNAVFFGSYALFSDFLEGTAAADAAAVHSARACAASADNATCHRVDVGSFADDGLLQRGKRDLAAGFGAELCACTLFTPYEILKQRMQVGGCSGAGGAIGGTAAGCGGGVTSSQTQGGRQSLRACMVQVHTESGARGFFVGLGACVGVYGPYSALFFASYEALKAILLPAVGKVNGGRSGSSVSPGKKMGVCVRAEPSDTKTGAGASFAGGAYSATSAMLRAAAEPACGVTAGAIAAAATQPIDCLKTRLQVSPNAAGRASMASVLRDVLLNEGPRVLFRGAAARVAWLAPGSGFTVTVFERTRGWLAPPDSR